MPPVRRHLNPETRSYGFSYTKFDIEDGDFRRIETAGFSWFVYQEEICATSGRRHIQGCGWYPTARKLKTLFKKLPGFHCECAIGSPEQNKVYCSKIDTRAPGARAKEHGTMPTQGARADLASVHDAIRSGASDAQLWLDHPSFMNRYHKSAAAFRRTLWKPRHKMTVTRVYVGPTGTGKSTAAQRDALAEAGSDDLWASFPCKENNREKTWFDGCAGMKVVVIDDYEGEIGYRLLLRMLDWTRMKGAVKGAFEHWAPELVIITSNVHPKDWYKRTWDNSPLKRRLTENGSYIKEFNTKYVHNAAAGAQPLEIEAPPMWVPPTIEYPDAQPVTMYDSDGESIASLD